MGPVCLRAEQEAQGARGQLRLLEGAAEADRGAALGMLHEAEAALRASHAATKRRGPALPPATLAPSTPVLRSGRPVRDHPQCGRRFLRLDLPARARYCC